MGETFDGLGVFHLGVLGGCLVWGGFAFGGVWWFFSVVRCPFGGRWSFCGLGDFACGGGLWFGVAVLWAVRLVVVWFGVVLRANRPRSKCRGSTQLSQSQTPDGRPSSKCMDIAEPSRRGPLDRVANAGKRSRQASKGQPSERKMQAKIESPMILRISGNQSYQIRQP